MISLNVVNIRRMPARAYNRRAVALINDHHGQWYGKQNRHHQRHPPVKAEHSDRHGADQRRRAAT